MKLTSSTVSPHSLSLRHLSSASNFRKRSLLHHQTTIPSSAPLNFLTSSSEFAVNITFGNQTFSVLVDTGSGETFVAGTDFQCLDVNGSNVSVSDCHLGNLYTQSDTFQPVSHEVFSETFAGGDATTGYVGYEQVTLGGIEVTQKVGIMTKAYWEVAEGTSGALGLAFPSGSTIYEGDPPTDPSQTTNATNLVVHNPLFFSMAAQGKLTSPVFTLALDRSLKGSTLTLGGVPEQFADAGFVTTPILPNLMPFRGEETLVNYLYSIEVAGVSVAGVSNMTAFKTIIDSGAKAILVDNSTAIAAIRAFNPPGYWSDKDGEYVVNCTAVGPRFDLVIQNTTLSIDPTDLIEPEEVEEGICPSVIQPSDSLGRASIIGNPFLRNVVAVFDVGHNEMHFAANDAI